MIKTRLHMNMKYLSLILVTALLIIGAAGAKEIVVSNGISLADTAENRTVVLKEVVTDMKAAPVALATKTVAKDEKTLVVVDEEKVYSASPVTDALLNMPIESKAWYKAEYIARYADIVGEHTVYLDGDVININIVSADYDPTFELIQMNLTASVNGIEKQIHNPFKISNPPVLVRTSPKILSPEGKILDAGKFVESLDTATLESISYAVKGIPDGQPTFFDGDPTVVIYGVDNPDGSEIAYIAINTTSDVSLTYLDLISKPQGNVVFENSPFYPAALVELYSDGESSESEQSFNFTSRHFMSFNTSLLQYAASVDNASLDVWGVSYFDRMNVTPSLSFTKFASHNTTVYSVSDYGTNGTETSRYIDDIPPDVFEIGPHNKKYFTPNGISQINTSGGFTQIVGRLSSDVNSTPVQIVPGAYNEVNSTWYSYSSSNVTGTTEDPYMTVVYTASPILAAITSNQTSVATGGYVQFNDTTTGGAITAWNWTFDNSTLTYSSTQNPVKQVIAPSHIASDTGPWTMTVRLNASNALSYGVSSNYTVMIMGSGWYPGLQAPIASFTSNATFSKTNVGKKIGFTDTSSNSPTYWEWTVRNVSDNSVLATSTTQNPTIQFTQGGNFSVNLTVKNSIGGSTRIEYMQVYGLGLPHADFYGQPTSGTPGMLVSFVDQSLKGTSTGLTCNWSFGDSTYSSTAYSSICGNVQHVYGYAGVYDVSFNVTNANGTSIQTKLQYITVAVDQNTHNTWYSPHAVQFRVWDSKSNPVVGTFINATADSSTFPPGSDWLVEMYGLNIDVANQMMNGTLAMNGTTDSSGAITFTMHPSVRYTIRVINPSNGLAHTTNVSPIDSTYTIRLTGSAANNTYMDMGYNTSLYVTEPDVHNVTMNLRYQDMSGRTSLLEFFVMARPNNTVIDYQTLSGFGTGTVLMNYTVPNVRAHQYSWYYNAIRTV